MLRVVTDASVDMPDGWEEKYQIEILPLNVRFGDETFTSEQITDSDTFYRMVQEKRIAPRTSLPSPGQIIDFYRKIANQGDTILSLHIASKMSGTFAAVQSAIRELANEFTIFPFDSGAGSAALGFMCRQARLLATAGVAPSSILANLETMKSRLILIFTLNTLEYAHLSGRISRLQAAVTSVLRIKPIVILRDGLLQMAEKVRTRQTSLDRVIQIAKNSVQDTLVDIAIVHANDIKTAQSLVDQARKTFNIREIILTELSIPVAANLGPGTIGVVAVPVEMEDK